MGDKETIMEMYTRFIHIIDELISNIQTYELRRSSQQKEETKRGRGLALKALDDDGSDFDE